jgi:signal transduction histidine kinase
VILQHAGLAAALRARCGELQNHNALDVSLTVDGELELLDPVVSLCIYRVSQETLSNVIRHAEATRAEVRLSRQDSWLHFSVRDDGQGFDVARARAGGGLGLISLEERVRAAGGTLSIESRLGFGTEVRARVPVGDVSNVTAQSIAGG